MSDREDENIIYVSGSEETRNENLRRENARKKNRTTALIVLLVVLVALGVGVYVHLRMRTFKGIKVISTAESSFDSTAQYLQFGDNLLKYTPDGVSYINSAGDVVWTAGEDFRVPIAAVRGDYAVVADKGGNLVAVFGLEGQISSLKMPYNICDIDVATQGAFAVILESDETNFIYMYDKNGNTIYEMQTSIDKSGYPMDISLSEDGEKLFTSYFKLDGVNIKNNLTAYNFGEVGQNENADRMVGGYSLEDEMVPKVQFVTNDVVAAFSDTEIKLYNMKEKPSERGSIPYDGEATSIFYCANYLGYIIPNPDAGSNTDYILRCFDLSGKQLFEYAFSMDFDRIYAAEEELIITGGNQCLIIQSGGRTKFSYTFDNAVKSIIPSSRNNEYVVTYESKTDIIRLKTEE